MSNIKGILPLLKPTGFTSHDCVNKLRRILHMKKIGHTGTLDPSVTGVLPLCIGQATRVAEFVQDLPKEYVGVLSIGQATDTEDADGEVLETKEVHPFLTEEQVRQVLATFSGTIEQIPPMYSAVKINGVRLHKLAREGKEVERKPRTVNIYEIEPLAMSLEQPFPEITFRIKCSKGTYVRTLCVDIGKKLGYPAHMKNLVRTASGPFTLKDCLTFEQIEAAVAEGRIDSLVKPLDWALLQYPELQVSDEQAKDVWNGKNLKLDMELPEEQLLRVYAPSYGFLGLYKVTYTNGQEWGKPEKVFRMEGE